jgi:hypothetical protein
MFILERLEFQGTERCPQYLWKQYVMCAAKEPLERVVSKQRRRKDWRITETAFQTLPDRKKRRGRAA